MAANKKNQNSSVHKGINLLKDVYGREQMRKQVYLLYRTMSIIFIFVVIVYTAVWGWSYYQITQLNIIQTKIDNKTIELEKYKDAVSVLAAYAARVDKISSIRSSSESPYSKMYDNLQLIRSEADGLLLQYKMTANTMMFTFKLPDEDSLNWFENIVNQNLKSQEWSSVVISSVRKNENSELEVSVSSNISQAKKK